MGIAQGWSPRELEDLVVACASCGSYPTGVALGARDWLESPDVLLKDELDARVWKARGKPPDAEHRSPIDDIDGDTATADVAWTVDATRVDPRPDGLTCAACDEDLAVAWRDITAAHNRLTTKDTRWLHSYVTMKETVTFGLAHANLGLCGDMGTFINVFTPSLQHGQTTIRQRALPLFVPAQRFIDLVDKKLLGAKAFLTKLASEEGCRVGGEDLPFPTQYEGPELVLDAQLGIGLAELAKALRDRGRTPLRGLGTLRTVDYEWDGDHGRLLYLEFDVRVRDDMAQRFDG